MISKKMVVGLSCLLSGTWLLGGCNQPLVGELQGFSVAGVGSSSASSPASEWLEEDPPNQGRGGRTLDRRRFMRALNRGPDPAPKPAGAVPAGNTPKPNSTAVSIDRKPTTTAAAAAGTVQPPQKAVKPEAQTIVVATEAEKNQVIAENWPKPDVALFLTGQQYGYYEPCGCTGLSNQKGGINRRDTLLTMIRDKGWNVLPLDVGNQVRRMGRQSEIKFLTTVDALKTMEYSAIGLGAEDLMLSPMEIFYAFTDADPARKNPFVSSNVVVIDKTSMERYRILNVGGRKIGVTAALGDEYREKITKLQNSSGFKGVEILPAADSLKEVSKLMTKDGATFRILLAHASLEESAKLAKEVPGFDLVVTSGGYGEPTYKPEPIPGTRSSMIQVGVKGMYVGLVGLYNDPKNPVRYQRIALSSQFKDSERMMKSFHAYQNQLKTLELTGLGLRPLTHQSNNQFVGTDRCGECHTTAHDIWKTTGHAKGTDDLVNPPERGNVPRHFDPECLSCHVTGWDPQGYKPFHSGFESLEKTPHMMQNGCENCHGPGSAHAEAEDGDDKSLQERFREEMKLPLDRARDKCLECHDIDNSPDFHAEGAFEAYWEKVKHIGKY